MEPHFNQIDIRVGDYLEACGAHGSTHQEAEQQLGLEYGYGPSSVRWSFSRLYKAGLVRDSGKWRRTRSGRRAIVWESTIQSAD